MDQVAENGHRTPKQWCEYAVQQVRHKLDCVPPDVESRIDIGKLNEAREKTARLEAEIAKLPAERDWRTDVRMLGVAQSLLRWAELVETGQLVPQDQEVASDSRL